MCGPVTQDWPLVPVLWAGGPAHTAWPGASISLWRCTQSLGHMTYQLVSVPPSVSALQLCWTHKGHLAIISQKCWKENKQGVGIALWSPVNIGLETHQGLESCSLDFKSGPSTLPFKNAFNRLEVEISTIILTGGNAFSPKIPRNKPHLPHSGCRALY